MSNSFKNPITMPLITDPVNIDKPIQEMQVKLGEIPWLQASFGRAFDSYKKDSIGKTVVYPQVWQGKGKDLLSVMPNDNLASQSFFRLEDPVGEMLSFYRGQYSEMKCRVHLIVWGNFDFIDRSKDYPFIEELKRDVSRKLNGTIFSPGSSITVLKWWEQADNVFKAYTIDKVAQQELVFPWTGFRVEMDLFYREDCKPA